MTSHRVLDFTVASTAKKANIFRRRNKIGNSLDYSCTENENMQMDVLKRNHLAEKAAHLTFGTFQYGNLAHGAVAVPKRVLGQPDCEFKLVVAKR